MVSGKKDDRTIDIEDMIGATGAKSQLVGYIRVSTSEQNTDRQLAGLNLDKVFTDKISGAKNTRPALTDMLAYVREGDTVIVHEIDRLARSLPDLIDIANQLKRKKVNLKILKENLTFNAISSNPLDDMIFHIFGAIAQYEREKIKRRQREGIELAVKAGKYKGRKPALDDDQYQQLKLDYQAKAATLEAWNETTYPGLAKKYKVSMPTLMRYIRRIKDELAVD